MKNIKLNSLWVTLFTIALVQTAGATSYCESVRLNCPGQLCLATQTLCREERQEGNRSQSGSGSNDVTCFSAQIHCPGGALCDAATQACSDEDASRRRREVESATKKPTSQAKLVKPTKSKNGS